MGILRCCDNTGHTGKFTNTILLSVDCIYTFMFANLQFAFFAK
jgi:hypothetical protein